MGRRLLERFEERVERLLGQHVNFVDNVDFEFRRRRRVSYRVAELADFLDPAVAGAVDFNHVERPALGNFDATRVLIIELDLWPAGAIQAFGKDSGDGGLARAARTAEQVGVRGSLLFDGFGEGLRAVLLSDAVTEQFRAVFSRYG